MPRKARYDLASFDLTVTCTECGYQIPPNEQMRLDSFGLMRCSSCGKEFTVARKGNSNQLGN